MKLSYLFVFMALSAALVLAEPDSFAPNLISPDQEDAFDNGNRDDSYFRRFLSWVAGDSDQESSLRGRRSLWSWSTGSGNCKRSFTRFFSSCSSKDDYSTGNQSGGGNNPNRPTTTRPPSVPITSLLASNKDFSDLVELVTAANLISTLSGDGPFTVFAPTDNAFKWYNMDDAKASSELTRILTYHVVLGEYKAEDLADGTELTTVEGRNITISISNGQPKVNCGSTITMVDMEASNGIVHTIDTPLNVFEGNKKTCP